MFKKECCRVIAYINVDALAKSCNKPYHCSVEKKRSGVIIKCMWPNALILKSI